MEDAECDKLTTVFGRIKLPSYLLTY